MRSGHLHRVEAAGRKIAAETKCDAGQKSSLDAAQLDSGMTLLRRVYDWREIWGEEKCDRHRPPLQRDRHAHQARSFGSWM